MTREPGSEPQAERGEDPTTSIPARQGLLPWAQTPWTRIFANPAFSLASSVPELARAMWLLAAHNWTTGPADDSWAMSMGVDPGHLLRLTSMGLYRDGWLLWMKDAREGAERYSSQQRDRVCKRYVHRGSTVELPKATNNKDKEKKKEKNISTSPPSESPSLHVEVLPSHSPPSAGEDQTPEPELRGVEDPGSSKPKATGRGTPLTRYWDSEWLRTRGVPYAWTRQDAICLAKCAQLASQDQQEVERRIQALLGSPDRFNAENATPRLLLSKWNSFAVKVAGPQKGAKATARDAMLSRLLNGGVS